MSETAALARPDPARTLALGGIALMFAGLALGEVYAIFISHVANGMVKSAWQSVAQAAVAGDPAAVQAAFDRIYELSARRARTMNAHSHVGAYGLIALALAVLQPAFTLPGNQRRICTALFLAGAWLHVTATFTAQYFAGPAGAVSIGGQVLALAGATGFLLGWVHGDSGRLPARLAMALAPVTARRLVRGGLLLVVIGMGSGLLFAIAVSQSLEPRMFDAMAGAVHATAAGDADTATGGIAEFKRLQSKIAITAAAHSHAIEFGFLLLLLAFLQPYVMLREWWRRTWTAALLVGAFALPVSVFLATIYGLRAAACADLAGGLALAGLAGMFIGIVRYTGASDQQGMVA